MSSINYKFPLQFGPQGTFAVNDNTIDAVVSDLKILILSNYGERSVHGDFGANLRSLIFEQSTNITQKAEDLVLLSIEKWMPFIQVNEINVTNSETNTTLRPNELNIKIKFQVGQIEGRLNQTVRN